MNKIAAIYSSNLQDIINANPGIDPNYLRVGQQICVPTEVQIYPSCPTTNYYVVKPGDTFTSIAAYFNVTFRQLLNSNYGINPDELYTDQVLCIPVAPSPINVVVGVNNRRLVVNRGGTVLRSYTIGIENPSSPIPRGSFFVISKNLDPGLNFGARWIGLNEAAFGIRGVNPLEFIEDISADNNIVLSNSDISELFNLVPVGTNVSVV